MYVRYCDVGKKSRECDRKSSILFSLQWVTINLTEIYESSSERPKLFTGDDNFSSLICTTAGNSTCNYL